MLKFIPYQRNANQNHNEVSSHTGQSDHHQKSLQKINVGEGVEKRESSYTVGVVQPPWRTVWRFLKKLEIKLPNDPAIPLLGIHPEDTRFNRDTCTAVFIAALFIIARTWKQCICLSADEWIRQLWYIYTMGYYSDIKRNAFE